MSNLVRIGDFGFQVADGGLMITVESKLHRFDPTESMELLDYLDKHRGEIQRAYTPEPEAAEPAYFSPGWYDQQLKEAFDNMPE